MVTAPSTVRMESQTPPDDVRNRGIVPSSTSHRIVLVAIVAIGAALRLAPAVVVGNRGPMGLGGLFMEFSRQIAVNGFRLPLRIPFYTDGGIPFAYPPLPFYVQALLTEILGLPPFLAANILPAVMAIASVFAVRWLTVKLPVAETTRLLMLVMFAVTPGTLVGHIEAAGLAESFGLTALLIYAALLAACWADELPSLLQHVLIGLVWGICVAASPGSAALSILMWLFWFAPTSALAPLGHRWRAMSYRVVSGLVALLVSSPYWLSVAANHGSSIFTRTIANQSQGNGVSALASEAMLNLGFEPLAVGSVFPVVGTGLVIAGAWVAVHSGLHALWIWLVLASIVPREGEWLVAAPGALLAGLCLGEVVLPAVVDRLGGRAWTTGRVTAMAISILLGLNLTVNLALSLATEAWWRPSLDRQFLDAAAWIERNAPQDARLVVIGPDGVLEWSPHLIRRTVLNVPYGTEWRPELQAAILGLWARWEKIEDAWTLWSVTRSAFGLESFGVLARTEKILTFAGETEPRVEVEVLFNNGSWAVARLAPGNAAVQAP